MVWRPGLGMHKQMSAKCRLLNYPSQVHFLPSSSLPTFLFYPSVMLFFGFNKIIMPLQILHKLAVISIYTVQWFSFDSVKMNYYLSYQFFDKYCDQAESTDLLNSHPNIPYLIYSAQIFSHILLLPNEVYMSNQKIAVRNSNNVLAQRNLL